MSQRLPPLTAIRAFDAVARHLSFKKAAGELHVTPAAVSYQVRLLEQHLGVTLFERLHRSIRLSDAGRRCHAGVRDAFARLAAAFEALHETADSALVVTAGPAFSAKWLAPRLHRFRQRHPHLDARIDASLALSDFVGDGVDIAVRFGEPSTASGLAVETLVEESCVPLCSPALLESGPPLRTPDDLAGHTLIHDDSLSGFRGRRPGAVLDWPNWLRAAGVEGVDTGHGLRFNLSDHALQAAADGVGVVLGRRVLATPDIAAGRLVVPFGPEFSLGLWFYLACPAGHRERAKVGAFCDWLREEMTGAAVG